MKTCSKCCKKYYSVPHEATLALDTVCPGYYFNCSCGSTLVFKYKKEEGNKMSIEKKIEKVKRILETTKIDYKIALNNMAKRAAELSSGNERVQGYAFHQLEQELRQVKHYSDKMDQCLVELDLWKEALELSKVE